MASRIQKLAERISVFGICTLATWMLCLPATAQHVHDFSVAYQRDAGESADDDPADTGERGAVDATDDAQQRAAETLTPAEQKAALERRAGERLGGRPQGRANVLGMSVQEGAGGRVQVVAVAAASPAFDAGVRKGDVIISFAGFQGESYRDWIEGMDRLVTDTPDGETIDVELMRGTKRVAAIVRAPEAKADDPRLPGLRGLKEQEMQSAQSQSGLPVIPQPIPIMNGSDNDIFIGNDPFAAAFNSGGGNVNDRAMAEIFRLSSQQQALPRNQANAPSNAQQDAATGEIANRRLPSTPDPTATTGRTGIAGFRNDANGLLVMIDIAGLEPGNYRVGIDDAGIVVGGGHATSGFSTGAVEAATTTSPQANPAAQPGAADLNSTNNATQIPVDGRTDQSDIPPSGLARPLSTPPSGQARPLSTPPSGQTRPLTATPTGVPDTRQPDAPPAEAPASQSGTGTLSQIGVLTVDQSGTGRLQQVVEGVQVADIIGQAIVIYAPAKPPQTAIPPDANVSGVREGAGDPNVPAQSQAGATSREVQDQALPAAAATDQVNGETQPVAGGVIRLLSDRRPSIGVTDSTGGQVNPQSQAPGEATDDGGPVERAALPQQQPR